MVTITLKLPVALSSELEAEAERQGTSKSSVVRGCLEEGLRKRRARRSRPSCLDLVGDLAGAFKGPSDLSTNPDYLAEVIEAEARRD
jgi:hypothetical protein